MVGEGVWGALIDKLISRFCFQVLAADVDFPSVLIYT